MIRSGDVLDGFLNFKLRAETLQKRPKHKMRSQKKEHFLTANISQQIYTKFGINTSWENTMRGTEAMTIYLKVQIALIV